MLTYNQFPQSPVGLLFTNARGHVVFTDSNFARLAHQANPGFHLMGALHSVLGIARDAADRLLADVIAAGRVDLQRIQLRTKTGSLVPTWAMSVASRDEEGKFIGADIILTGHLQDTDLQLQIADHSDVLGLHIEQLMAEARALQERSYLQIYLTAQIDGLQLLVMRMAGEELRGGMESRLNKEAELKQWPLALQDGQVVFTHSTPGLVAHYGEMLRAAASYTADIVSRRMVIEEIDSIDRRLDPQTLKALSDMGLRIQL